jgi:hypothetical protein
MRLSDLRELALEGRDVIRLAREELAPEAVGPVVVSGMLAEQLARELAAGAVPGAVTVGDGRAVEGAAIHVHVIAGELSAGDDTLVRGADHAGVPVVLVQTWPQADWTAPFVLSPFVVECKTGEGFPVPEIADRIAEATDRAPALASRIPVLTEGVSKLAEREAVARAAYLGAARGGEPGSRPKITMEQVRMLSRLWVATTGSTSIEQKPLVGAAAGVLAAGFVLREAARRASRVLPTPLANIAVAAAGTWALAKALQTVESRLASE